MKKEEIHFGDIERWLFGQAPPEFMIEVLVRTILIYLFLLLVVRLMGKRMAGEMTLSEMAVMITLGAIVSPAAQLPDRGVMFGIVALLCALAFQRGLNLWEFRNPKVERAMQGDMSLLVKDGKLNLEELEKTKVTKQQVFAMLREKKIQNLAKVERAYLEACGIFSVYESDEVKPGLPLFPHRDSKILDIVPEVDSNKMACSNCGHVQTLIKNNEACDICNSKEWNKAYLSE